MNKEMKFITRPNTTDQQVIKEVITKNCYQKHFKIEESDIWLDAGANIGTFTVLALSLGAKVISIEPEPENYELLLKNIELNGFQCETHQCALFTEKTTLELYLGSTPYQKYTHTLRKTRGRKSISVITMIIPSGINCIKMDIEGAEIAILESISDWTGIKKLVFEYDFKQDKSIVRFKKLVGSLSKHFIVFHCKIPDIPEWIYFPSGILVHCICK